MTPRAGFVQYRLSDQPARHVGVDGHGGMKGIVFLGGALGEVRSFPESARKKAGVQSHDVQQGSEPGDWKPLGTIGSGVREIRIHEDGGPYRVLYLTQLADAVVVPHAFEKKAQKPAKRDHDLANDQLRTFTAMQMKESMR